MSKFQLSRVLPGSPEEVFPVLGDFAGAADVVSGIERVELLTDGPVGPGTRFRETRVFMKREATEELEVVAWDPPRGYSLAASSMGCDFVTDVSLRPEGTAGDSTRVTMEVRATPRTLGAKLMAPLSALMSGAMKKAMEQDLIDVGAALERRGASGA